MKKRTLSLLLAAVLVMTILPTAAFAAGSLSNFTKASTYVSGMFADVPSPQWYAVYVKEAYEYGLLNGKSASSFEPDSNLKVSEAIKLAACLHSIYNTGSASFKNGSPWYQPYVDYALANGIISSAMNYEANATRADFAVILAATLPDNELGKINEVGDNAIPDVDMSFSYAAAVYKLYRAGILAGSNDKGSFFPNDHIKRSEVAAIATRMVNTAYRKHITLDTRELTAEDIFEKYSSAVFKIEVLDTKGELLSYGTGFFLNSTGLAATSFGVLKGGKSARVLTADGKYHYVQGIYDYSEQNKLALIQVQGSNFPYLTVGDSSSLLSGASIYAISCPLGLAQTITSGIVTNAAYAIDDVTYIMNNAPISIGSYGGAMMNASGQVIGMIYGFYEDGQNLNLALPLSHLDTLDQSDYVPFDAMYQLSDSRVTASTSDISLYKREKVTVSIDCTGDASELVYSVGNKAVASCDWGSRIDDDTILLNISGLSAGSTTITLSLLDHYKNVMASIVINVTVNTLGANTPSYPKHPAIPDFGTFAGVSLYKSWEFDTFDEYFYRLSDMKQDPEVLLWGYADLLEQKGLELSSSFRNSDDKLVIILEGGGYDHITLSFYNSLGVECIEVFIYREY